MDKSLEFRLEKFKDMSNIKHELLKSFYNRQTIAERYMDGSVAIHVHLFTSKDSVCVSCINAKSDRVPNYRESLVFVRVGEFTNELRPVTSVVRLQSLEFCNVLSSQSVKMPVVFPEVLFRIYNDKLSVLYATLGIKAGQLINQIIQGLRRFWMVSPMRRLTLKGAGRLKGKLAVPMGTFNRFPLILMTPF
ncbi:MAG: hypothetical protein ABIH70_02395 [Chloroflexota bacterium]